MFSWLTIATWFFPFGTLITLQRGDTAFIAALGEGHLPVVQLLIDRGADVNVKDWVCHLIPGFCRNTVTDVNPSNVDFMANRVVLLCFYMVSCVRACAWCVCVFEKDWTIGWEKTLLSRPGEPAAPTPGCNYNSINKKILFPGIHVVPDVTPVL